MTGLEERSKLADKEEETSKELIKLFDKANRFKERYTDLESVLNWLLAIAAAALLWALNSIDKFIIERTFQFKPLYITAVICLGLSVVSFGTARSLLIIYAFFTKTARADIGYLPSKVLFFLDSKEDILSERKKTFMGAVEVLLSMDSMVSLSFKITLTTILLLLPGLFLLTLYVILFLVRCV